MSGGEEQRVATTAGVRATVFGQQCHFGAAEREILTIKDDLCLSPDMPFLGTCSPPKGRAKPAVDAPTGDLDPAPASAVVTCGETKGV